MKTCWQKSTLIISVFIFSVLISCSVQHTEKQSYSPDLLTKADWVDREVKYKNVETEEVNDYVGYYYKVKPSLAITDTTRIIDPVSYTEVVQLEERIQVLQKGDIEQEDIQDDGTILHYLKEGDSLKIYRVLVPKE